MKLGYSTISKILLNFVPTRLQQTFTLDSWGDQESLSSLRVEVLIKTSQSTIAMVMSGSRLLYLRVRSRYAQSIQSMHKRLGQQKALSQTYGNDDEITVILTSLPHT